MIESEIMNHLREKFPSSEFKLDGKKLFRRHCGKRMWKVRSFAVDGCQSHRYRGDDILVCACPDCDYIHEDICYE